MKRKSKSEQPEVQYIGVADSVGLRKAVLESIKDLIHGLKRYELHKEIRKDTKEEVEKFKVVLKQIQSNVSFLKSKFPNVVNSRFHLH